MKTFFLCGGFLFCLLVSAQGAESNADEKEVTEAVRSMFGAFAADDFAKFHEVAAADFYAFDGGEPYKGDELIELLKKLHTGGKTFVWTITEPKVHVDGGVAWITYVNDGSIRDSSGTKNWRGWNRRFSGRTKANGACSSCTARVSGRLKDNSGMRWQIWPITKGPHACAVARSRA